VQPLNVETVMDAATLIEAYGLCKTKAEWDAIEVDRAKAWPKMPAAEKLEVKAASEAAFMAVAPV
jgi:hypothetical protein